ncbi:MAG: serine/threonine-protein kinase [Kofleriaceae bacterium]
MAKPAPQTRHLGPGDKLGKYELIRQIAIGGMAELYLARTVGIEGFEKLVVCKRILPQFATNQSFVTMFLNEARLAATLQHPNVAQVYDIGMDDGEYFFAMEYVHGEDLDRISQQSQEQGVPISLDAALTLAAGLCAGLHYAHEKGVVHRDVSPSNVLVSYDGSVKLVDFGIARTAQGKITTSGGGLKGKITYMSPEQCRADVTLDRRSDIYSIGTLLFELTTGRTPFTGETEYAVLNQIVNRDVPMPSTFVPGYPPALEQLVVRALAREPSERYPTAMVLQGALEDFAHENRLRISPLTLGRLMGTLFPAKLEEWDHAKAQGAFFVEQHVVRTLIESGKTPDPNDPETRAQIKAMAQQLGVEDPTVMTAPPEMDQTATRPIRASSPMNLPPGMTLAPMPGATVTPIPRAPTPIREAPPLPPAPTPPVPQPIVRAPTPFPGAPPLMPAGAVTYGAPGTLVSSTSEPYTPVDATHTPVDPRYAVSHAVDGNVPAMISPQYDVTDRVHVPRPRAVTPTNFIRAAPRRKGPIVALVVLAAAAGGVVTYIASSGGGNEALVQPAAKPAPEPEQAPPAPAPAPAIEQKQEAVTPPPPVEPAPAPPPVAEDKPKPAKIVVKKPPQQRPRPKPTAKQPEDKAWDADSPFMPVRSH